MFNNKHLGTNMKLFQYKNETNLFQNECET